MTPIILYPIVFLLECILILPLYAYIKSKVLKMLNPENDFNFLKIYRYALIDLLLFHFIVTFLGDILGYDFLGPYTKQIGFMVGIIFFTLPTSYYLLKKSPG